MVSVKVQHILSKAWIALAALLAVAILWSMQIASAAETASADQRIVTIHDRGVEQTIITRAETVAGALNQAGIVLDEADLVEPASSERLIANNYSINVYRARPVVVSDGQKRIRVVTAEQSPRQIAAAAGTTMYDEDEAKIGRVDDVLTDGGAGLKLSIDRATPFTFVLYGKRLEARTQATTVGDMLKEKEVVLGPQDGSSVAASVGIVAGMTIEVWRNGVQTVTQEEDIPMPIEQVKDQDRPVGFREVKTPGTPGKKQVTYEINMQNGVEVSRKMIQEVKSLEPVKQVEIVGAKLPTPTNPSEAAALGHQMMLNFGFGEEQWPCLYNLWLHESGWTTTAGNPSSGAYGIPQSLPASKMAVYGADYLTNASVQITWGLNYIKGRYGTPCGAYDHWHAKNWY